MISLLRVELSEFLENSVQAPVDRRYADHHEQPDKHVPANVCAWVIHGSPLPPFSTGFNAKVRSQLVGHIEP